MFALSCFTCIFLRVDRFWRNICTLMLHLYPFESWFFFKKYLHSHASLISFWEMIIVMVICTRYEFGPKVMNIQEGYNKNFHEDHWILKTWFLAIVLRYGDSDIWVMLVSNYALVRILVLRFVIPYACMKVNSYATKLHPTCGALFIVSYV